MSKHSSSRSMPSSRTPRGSSKTVPQCKVLNWSGSQWTLSTHSGTITSCRTSWTEKTGNSWRMLCRYNQSTVWSSRGSQGLTMASRLWATPTLSSPPSSSRSFSCRIPSQNDNRGVYIYSSVDGFIVFTLQETDLPFDLMNIRNSSCQRLTHLKVEVREKKPGFFMASWRRQEVEFSSSDEAEEFLVFLA